MLPNVKISVTNGNLGRVAPSDDGIAGLILTGTAVADKLTLNKPYILSSTRDLINLGVTTETNYLVDKEVKAFFAQSGEGSELHLLVVSNATTMTQMCAAMADSPLSKLIESTAGRIRLVGVNKIAPEEYTAQTTQGIDSDAINAVQAAQECAESFTERVYPFRIFIAAPGWTGSTDSLFKPSEANCNRVAMVLASDDEGKSSAIAQVLGRAAKIEPQQSLGRVLDNQIAAKGWYTDGSEMQAKAGLGNALHDAGYIFYRSFPRRNGCYLNGSPMCAPVTDDFSTLYNGRVIDKAVIIAYSTYISQIQDNVQITSDGTLNIAVCKSYEGMIDNAVGVAMKGQISGFESYVDPAQNVLSSGTLEIVCGVTPLGVLDQIKVNLSLTNPAKQ